MSQPTEKGRSRTWLVVLGVGAVGLVLLLVVYGGGTPNGSGGTGGY